MKWRDDKRKSILADLSESTAVHSCKPGLLQIGCTAWKTRANRFGIDLSQEPLRTHSFSIEASATTVDLPRHSARVMRWRKQAFSVETDPSEVEVESSRPSLLFSTPAVCRREMIRCRGDNVQAVRLEINASCVRSVSTSWEVPLLGEAGLTFSRPKVESFAFGLQRQEPTLFSGCQPKGEKRLSLPRVPRPDPPPRSGVDLRERLQWILTPPINEVLSDPHLALPEPPYPYQMAGIAWLLERQSALLADEMGLGKTMQAILATRLLWRDRKINRLLVVCPKILIPNWIAELRKWWPEIVSHNTKIVDSDPEHYLRLATANMTVKIINYERLARTLDWLKDARFTHDLVVLDEAQRIKNPESRTAQAVKLLKSEWRWALTGTPLENRVEDVVSIFEFLSPGLLKSDSADYVRKAIRPYMLRRRTEEVLKDLPEVTFQDVEVELGSEQRCVYQQIEDHGVTDLNSKGDSVTVTHVFALITKLMQVCNFTEGGDSAKLEYLLEDLEDVVASNRKALVFSRFVSEDYGLQRITPEVARMCFAAELHGKVATNQRYGVIEKFNASSGSAVLLLNYAVGGLGLNLQSANYVYLFDRWWNPAVEDQAIKRAHRIGQQNKVIVRRFVCRDTIEERIVQKLREKRRLFSHVIDEGRLTAADFGLTEEDLFSLFKGLVVRPRRHKEEQRSIGVYVDQLLPAQFEELTARIYEAEGYKVTRRGGPYDQGIDLIAEKRGRLGPERIAVQCKHTAGPLGPNVLRELWGAVSNDATITRGDLVTSGRVTSAAMQFATEKRLTVIDCDELGKLAKQTGVAEFLTKLHE